MNTTGFIRGYMAKNMENEKFLIHVLDCLKQEFGFTTNLNIDEDNYKIVIENYEVNLNKEECRKLQERGAYILDRYILEDLEAKEFKFDKERSQYIRYCFNIFYKNEASILKNS